MLRKNFLARRGVLGSLGQSAIVWVVVVGLCALNFPARADANDSGFAASTALTHLRLWPQADPGPIVDRPTVASRWNLLPEPSWLLPPAPPKFLASGKDAEATRFANYSFAIPSPVPAARVAVPANPSSGRGRWLALGIAGIVVAAVGAVAYVGERDSICGGSSSGSRGCSEVKTVGLVLMPVGGVMAVVGFVMHSRH